MNTILTYLSNKSSYLIPLAVGVLLFGVWQKWWTIPSEVYVAMMALELGFLRASNATAQAQSAPASKSNLPTSAPLFILMLLPLALLAGCQSNPAVIGHVISVTDRGFGINVQTASSPNSTPSVKLGFFSQTVFLEPVVTNNVANVPAVANTFSIDNAAAPFTFGVDETLASGIYRTGNATNNTAAEPAIPK